MHEDVDRVATSGEPQTPDWVDAFFPSTYDLHPLPRLIEAAFRVFAETMPNGDMPRMPGKTSRADREALVEAYGDLPEQYCSDPESLIASIARDFFAGAVNWRTPDLQYNLGAAVNAVAAAAYSTALDVNVYLINDGLAGNAIQAEEAVGRALTGLAGVPAGRGHAVFTFGGTGTVTYALKMGIAKAAPMAAREGVPQNAVVAITEDAHFSHLSAVDWVGLGTDCLLVLPAGEGRRTQVQAAGKMLREALASGRLLVAIVVNGGTTYDHTVDDIAAFVELRDNLVAEFNLPYVPHIHVDSVVGWNWLVFAGYDFAMNPLDINAESVSRLESQYMRVREVRRADSWGVDFHKGAGACPIDCSAFVVNERSDLLRLSRGNAGITSMHQLAEQFSVDSPADYTLETSRAGGKAIAAIAALHSMGREGYRWAIANLVSNALLFRKVIHSTADMVVLNDYSLGYQSMIRLYPPNLAKDPRRVLELQESTQEVAEFSRMTNDYMLAFFKWDDATRMSGDSPGVVYSFSRQFVVSPSGVPISGLKIYPTSPRTTADSALAAARLLIERKAKFDECVGLG